MPVGRAPGRVPGLPFVPWVPWAGPGRLPGRTPPRAGRGRAPFGRGTPVPGRGELPDDGDGADEEGPGEEAEAG